MLGSISDLNTDIIEEFGNLSGLKLNKNKTE
jgi:hypothetical protein